MRNRLAQTGESDGLATGGRGVRCPHYFFFLFLKGECEMKKIKTVVLGTCLFVSGTVVGVKGYHKLMQFITRDPNYLRTASIKRISDDIITFLYGKEGENK